jgi:hypothetical protein
VKLATVLSVFRSERVGNGGEAPTFAHFRSSGLLASVRLLRAAIRLAGVLVTGVVSRRPVGPLGDEDRRPLPGDELLPDAKIRWTHGITMRAWPTEIWSGSCRWGADAPAGTATTASTTAVFRARIGSFPSCSGSRWETFPVDAECH